MSTEPARPPALALGALGVSVLAAMAVLGEANIGSLRVPGLALGLVAIVGLVLSSRRWDPDVAAQAPVNLGICFGGAIVLIATRATVDGADPPGGLHAIAEVLAFVLACRSFAITDTNRVRSGLLLSMGALLGGAADSSFSSALPWLALWTVAAVTALVRATDLGADGARPLVGSRRRPLARGGRTLTSVLAIVGVVLLAGAAVAVVDPRPGRSPARFGRAPGSQKISPYVGYERSLDTSRRFQLSDEVVMRIDAGALDFWRGQSFDVWDGRTWTASPSTASVFPVEGDGSVPAGIGDPEAGGETFVQRVKVVAPYMQAIFGAYRIDQVDTPLDRMAGHGDGSIALSGSIGPGTEYTVISLRQPVTPDLLRQNDPVTADLPAFMSTLFLQLPPAVPPRVTALAHQLTDGEPTAYDKVQAIERWLGANTTYTLDIPPLPAGADAVDQYLFVDKRGFCEQIATSLAVLLRSVGVPARIATGYAGGERSVISGEITVRAKDAHAWVEVWFPGVGWQAFDPTARVPLAGASSTTSAYRLAGVLRALAPWLGGLAVLALVALAARLMSRRWAERRAAARAPWATRFLAELERLGEERGRPRAPPETPAEYAAALGTSVLRDDRLAFVGAVLSRAAYGGQVEDDEVRSVVEAIVAEAARAAPAVSRGRRRRGSGRAPRGS